MYKIVGIGRNNIQIELSNEDELMTFDSEEEALIFINKNNPEKVIPNGYKLVVEKI